MAPWSRPRRSRARITRPALTASAQQIDRENTAAARQQQSGDRRAHRALSFYSSLGEIWYPANNFGRVMSRIRWYPALLVDGEPVEVEDGPLLDLFDRIQDPGGGSRAQLAASYGVLDFVIGEGLLTVTVEDDVEQWEFLSPLEMTVLPDDTGYERVRFPGAANEKLRTEDGTEPPGDGEAHVWRLWRRHPAYSGAADSPVKSVLELCELLQWLRLAAASSAASRAAQRGGLYVPEELTFGDEPDPATDEDVTMDAFTGLLTESLENAIKNPGTAAAASPLIVRGPAALLVGDTATPTVDLLKWFPLGPDGDTYNELEATREVIAGIANGLDLPVDWVTGDTGQSNHWSGWLVDEQAFRLHIAPVADRFARDLTSAYLRPAAIAAGVPDAENVVIGYDPALAINHPDEIKTAETALRNAAVGFDYYREKIGAKDSDAPDDEEIALIFALQGKTPPGEEPTGAVAPQDGGRGGDVIEEPPNGQPAEPALTAARVIGALEATVQSARHLAGNRLWSKAQGCEPCRESMDPVPRAMAAHALGRPLVADVLRDSDEFALVAGAGKTTMHTLARLGVDADNAAMLVQLAEQHAARTLYDPEPPPLPPGVHAVVAKAIR